MKTTPRSVIDHVVHAICGRGVERLIRITSGGLHETYRVVFHDGLSVILRIARRPVPWFTDEAHLMAMARQVGVPTPDVLGVEHVLHDGESLSCSLLSLVQGHPLSELIDTLSALEVERLVEHCGELLARLHSVTTDRGMSHVLKLPDDDRVERAVLASYTLLGSAAASHVERGAERLHMQVKQAPKLAVSLAHGDWLPKHLMINNGIIVGVIDWEFAGSAPSAFDLARWEVSAGDGFHDANGAFLRGYRRIANSKTVMTDWISAFAIDWALEILGWKNPASQRQQRRCVHVIEQYMDTL